MSSAINSLQFFTLLFFSLIILIGIKFFLTNCAKFFVEKLALQLVSYSFISITRRLYGRYSTSEICTVPSDDVKFI